MAWTTPMTATANSVFTAAQFNTHVRDNLNETAPAKATTAGRIFVATGANAIAERAPTAGNTNTSESTSSTSFVDLATVGPTFSLTTGSTVFVILGAGMSNSTAGANCQMGVAVSGASSVSAASNEAWIYESGNAGDFIQGSYAFHLSVTPGSNTFTAKYAVSGGTGTFLRRRMIILPFG